MFKPFLSALAIALTLFLYFPYIRSIQKGKINPHVFSWVLWGVSTLIVCFAQLAGKGGSGSWALGVSGSITCYIAVLAYVKRGDTTITKLDWVFFIAALAALPFWFFTSDPLWAVVTLTTTDLIAFGPTARRAYHNPHGESVSFFALCGVRNGIVIIALEHYSLTTVLFPAVIGAACFLVSLMLVVRRPMLPVPAG